VIWLAAASLWAGASLALTTVPALRRPMLTRRLLPYVAPRITRATPAPTWRQRLAPLTLVVGERLSALAGAVEPLERRLRRVHADGGAAGFRFRQLSQAALALVSGAGGAAVLGGPPVLMTALVLAAPVAVFLAHEQLLAHAVRRRREALFRELPVIAEQLAMHLAAGYSVSAGVVRLSERSSGVAAADFARIASRLRQGLSEPEALREWADLAGEPAVDHLVAVLTLDHQATDLDRLVEQEAEAVRAEANRRLLDQLERRAQQVWVPVTVATLLPGSLLLLVPFLDAVRLFAA
jgi:Flp pilus assembly protein TadB